MCALANKKAISQCDSLVKILEENAKVSFLEERRIKYQLRKSKGWGRGSDQTWMVVDEGVGRVQILFYFFFANVINEWHPTFLDLFI